MIITYKGQAIKIITRNETRFSHELPAFTLTGRICHASANICTQCKFNNIARCVDNVIKSSSFKEQFPELFI